MSIELTVLMPVFNERVTFERAIGAVLSSGVSDSSELVVDDGSTDGTREWLREQMLPDSVHVRFREKNHGKGAALRTGSRRRAAGSPP